MGFSGVFNYGYSVPPYNPSGVFNYGYSVPPYNPSIDLNDLTFQDIEEENPIVPVQAVEPFQELIKEGDHDDSSYEDSSIGSGISTPGFPDDHIQLGSLSQTSQSSSEVSISQDDYSLNA